jgi:nucleoside 2-deoxyribosyltransferase
MDEKAFAFVLMPFDSEFADTYSLGIKDTVEEAGMIAERVDEQVFHRERILERIYNQIDIADFIIADMTGRNPNVFYEVGYAHAKNKLCVLLTKNADDIPFDLKHHRHIVYQSLSDLKQKLRQDMEYMKEQLALREMPIRISLSEFLPILKRQNITQQRWSPYVSICRTSPRILRQKLTQYIFILELDGCSGKTKTNALVRTRI